MIDIIEEIHSNSNNKKRTCNEKFWGFVMKSGLKQDWVLSPITFSVILDDGLEKEKYRRRKDPTNTMILANRQNKYNINIETL